MRRTALLLVAVVGSACAAAAMTEPRTAKAENKLLTELQGKAAGAPVSCLPPFRTNDIIIIDDNTVLFRESRNKVYRNDPLGGCAPMGNVGYSLVTRSTSSRMCRGDIVQVTDLRSGVVAGSCSLGDFVPYQAVAR